MNEAESFPGTEEYISLHFYGWKSCLSTQFFGIDKLRSVTFVLLWRCLFCCERRGRFGEGNRAKSGKHLAQKTPVLAKEIGRLPGIEADGRGM